MYYLELSHWWFVVRSILVKRLIASLNIPSPLILDVGCGTGANLLFLNKVGRAFGIDYSFDAIRFCAKRGIDKIIQGAAEKIPYGDSTFDIITSLDLLEHVSNPFTVLSEMKRVLKDEGRIIITVPASRTLFSQHDVAACHFRRYNKYSLLCDLNEAGLKIIKINYLFFLTFFIIAPMRLVRKFFIAKERLRTDTEVLFPRFINIILEKALKTEAKFSIKFALPLGTTLYAVVCKDA